MSQLLDTAAQANVVWWPQPGSQTLALTVPNPFELLLDGTRGSGKTDAALMRFCKYVGKGYGPAWRGIVFREEARQLGDLIARSRRWIPRIWPGAKYTETPKDCWTWPSGETLLFRHGKDLGDYDKYHGHEYPFQWFEELTNWASGEFYEAMESCCRSSQAGTPRLRLATCNPFGKGHGWVKERFKIGGISPLEESNPGGRSRMRIHGSVFENKALLEADPHYLQTLRAIKDVNRRKAWLLGDWDIHVGSFLEGVWNPTQHVVQPFVIPPHWAVWKAMDWGYAAPFAVYWFALDPEGCYYLWRELYGAGEELGKGVKKNAKEVAAMIKKAEQHDVRHGLEYRVNLADPSIWADGLGQYGMSRSIEAIFREENIRWQKAWNSPGSRKNGAQWIVQLLQENKLKVFATCQHWLRTVPALLPDPYDPEDVDTTQEDHAWDATRYGLTRARRIPQDLAPEHNEDSAPIFADGQHRFNPRSRNE